MPWGSAPSGNLHPSLAASITRHVTLDDLLSLTCALGPALSATVEAGSPGRLQAGKHKCDSYRNAGCCWNLTQQAPSSGEETSGPARTACHVMTKVWLMKKNKSSQSWWVKMASGLTV